MTSRTTAVVAVALVLMGGAACNSKKSSTGPTSPAPVTTTDAPTTAATTAATTASGGVAPDGCSLLTSATISQAMGYAVGPGESKIQPAPLGGHACIWATSTAPIVTFQVVVRSQADITNGESPSDLYDQTVTAFTSFDHLKPVAGIGDKAEIGDANGYVLVGGLYLNTVIGEKGHPQVASALLSLTKATAARLA